MEAVWHFLGCASIEKADRAVKDASDMQLSAFEFRHYRTGLEQNQHKLVERVVNQWVAMLVKGVVITVAVSDVDAEEARETEGEKTVFLDKDLLNMEISGELYPLDALCRMEMKTKMMKEFAPWMLDLTFDFEEGKTALSFSFEQERHRLQFALMLRILRARSPHLKTLDDTFEVLNHDHDDDEDPAVSNFNKLVGSTRFDVQGTGITIIISVDTLHIHQRLPCSNRYSYLELFSDYPRRDKFLYAKSQQTFDLPKEVVLGAGDAKNARREDEHADQSDGRKGSKADQNLCTIKLGSDLKNVKLKIPKVPFTIRGRLMAQDTFFATVVAVFQLDISKGHLQDMREAEVPGDKPPKVSEAEVPLFRSRKHAEEPQQLATLNVRFTGYVTEENTKKKQTNGGNNRASNEVGSSRGEEEDSEDELEEEEEEEEEESDGSDEGEGQGNSIDGSGSVSKSQLSSAATSST